MCCGRYLRRETSRRGAKFHFWSEARFSPAAPAFAVVRYAPDLKYVFVYILGISTVTWFAYAHDKKRAQSGGWRIPEVQLHFLELLGGWPAAFLAQRYIRHKTKKLSYKLTFWIIILTHQYIALDSLLDWKLTKAVVTAANGRSI